MCVHYARQLTSFSVQGDAWMWWQNSAGRYQHGSRPVEGSVLVFRRTGRLHYGHVSVVSRVVDRRTILVDHSWLEGDTLHRGMKVIDTSPNNNWSSVKVWYEPSDHLGLRTYPTFGFIYPRGGKGVDQALTVAANDAANDDDDVAGAGKAEVRPVARRTAAAVFQPHHKPAPPRIAVAAAEAPATMMETLGKAAADLFSFLPRRKPELASDSAQADQELAEVPQVVVPRHKPGFANAPAQAGLELTEVPQVVVPRHKPSGHGGSQQVADRGASDLND